MTATRVRAARIRNYEITQSTMNALRSTFVRNSLSNVAFFALAAIVFIAFTVIYTRTFGIEQYGAFSFLLNTMTALISLGAYEGFLITRSLTGSRTSFDAFNKRFLLFNTALVLVAACVFAIITGSLDAGLLIPVITAIWLDYRSQSSIAVLITGDNNWKIRACRTAYQIILVSAFLAMRSLDVALGPAFGLAALAASVTNYALLYRSARHSLPEEAVSGSAPAADAKLLGLAILSNLAMVAALLLDKTAIRLFDVGSDFSVGLYFLFFDLATRAEALYLLLSAPVTNHLYNNARAGALPGSDIWLMIGASAGIGAAFAIAGTLIVPLLYDVTLADHLTLPFIFGLYVAARGVRYIVKALCNATGLHMTLTLSNWLVLGGGAILLSATLAAGNGSLSVVALASVLTAAHLLRLPILVRMVTRGDGIRETMKPGVA